MSSVFGIITIFIILAAFGVIVALIVQAVRKRPVKPLAITLLALFGGFIVAVTLGVITDCKHEYVKTEDVAPGCESRGYTLYRCALCEREKKDDYAEANGHVMAIVSRIEPSFEAAGEKVERCDMCGEERIETLKKLTPTPTPKPTPAPKPTPTPTPTPAPSTTDTVIADTTVTFDEIYIAFKENELVAKEKYNRNRYRITAKINGMETGGLFNLTGGATLTMQTQVGNTVVFFLAEFEKDQEEALKKIVVGDTITFDGDCWNGTFSNCEIVE